MYYKHHGLCPNFLLTWKVTIISTYLFLVPLITKLLYKSTICDANVSNTFRLDNEFKGESLSCVKTNMLCNHINNLLSHVVKGLEKDSRLKSTVSNLKTSLYNLLDKYQTSNYAIAIFNYATVSPSLRSNSYFICFIIE